VVNDLHSRIGKVPSVLPTLYPAGIQPAGPSFPNIRWAADPSSPGRAVLNGACANYLSNISFNESVLLHGHDKTLRSGHGLPRR
jgi:hypothetical protein